ncbi:MAG TPA: hypothetical protein VD766_03625 [Solirubrobacterales bacterium]|nr:hypothetical protein [Solirubrobacterales bacterium]
MVMRQLASIFMIALGGIALVGGILTRYADQNLLDPERFAENAVGVLDEEGAQAEIADVIVNELEKRGADRAATQKAVDKNIEEVTSDEAFREALTTALVIANEAALEDQDENVNVKVEDVGGTLADALSESEPQLAEQIERDLDLVVANTDSTGTLVAVARKADDVSSLSLILPILGGLLMAGGVVVANDRRTAVFGAATGVAIAGVAVFAGYLLGREIAARQPDDDAAQDAARAIWDAVFGGLETLGLVMAGVGALVALIAGVANRVHVPGRE